MSGEDLEQTLLRLLLLYNEHLPQSAMNSKTPMDAMNMRHTSRPQLFFRSPGSNRPGCADAPNQSSFYPVVLHPEQMYHRGRRKIAKEKTPVLGLSYNPRSLVCPGIPINAKSSTHGEN
jgi:hypothetical protein